MGLEDILEDVLFKSLQHSKSPGSMDIDSEEPVVATTKGGTPDILILTMERECRKQYTDPGDGLHFVGLLLAVFAAELVSAYWAQNAPAMKTAGVDRGPARMITVLYSAESVAFVLSHPTEVFLAFENLLTGRHKDRRVKRSRKVGHTMELLVRKMSLNSYMSSPPRSIFPTVLSRKLEYPYPSSAVREDIPRYRRRRRARSSIYTNLSRRRIYCHL